MRNDDVLNSQPFFTIIITTYNRAQLLKRALNSLITQTEEDWEAIIVDDDSSDNTYSEVLPYIKSDGRIKYSRKAHGGDAHAKNEGVRLSEGKYISFLDSDDEFKPTHLESRKAILIQNPSVRFLYGGAEIIGNQYVPDRFDYANKININQCVIGGTFFIERNILISLNGFKDILIGTDADLFEKVKKARVTMLKTDPATYIYHREAHDSITNNLYRGIERFNTQKVIDRIGE